MVDLFEYMNKINNKLQGKGTFPREMYSVVKAFMVKIKLFCRHLSQNYTTHFATLPTTAQRMMLTEKFTNIIFGRHFEKLGA